MILFSGGWPGGSGSRQKHKVSQPVPVSNSNVNPVIIRQFFIFIIGIFPEFQYNLGYVCDMFKIGVENLAISVKILTFCSL
jgi:hypothetical protein